MGRAIDLFVTYRFLKLLTTPFEKQDAFKFGIIDADGNRITKPKSTRPAVELNTAEMKNSYTILHKLVFNIKKLFSKNCDDEYLYITKKLKSLETQMGFLDNSSTTVDAILTKKGRELLARGRNEFKITKFALADDEIDYTLWDVTNPNGTNFYGAVIENMPLLEAIPDENQMMRYKLVTLPKNTAKMPILEMTTASLTFQKAGIKQTLSPNTRNASDATLGYTFVLHNSDACRMMVSAGGEVSAQGATIPTFIGDDDRKNSITIVAKSVDLIARTLSSDITTQVTIVGNETGATVTVPLTVKADVPVNVTSN